MCHACIEQGNDDFAAISEIYFAMIEGMISLFGPVQCSWNLIGDPTSGMQLSIADQLDTISATGQWKMHVSYDYSYDFDPGYVQHWDEDVNGSFDDTLRWNGSGFDITSQSVDTRPPTPP
jgi:hypothetical protein